MDHLDSHLCISFFAISDGRVEGGANLAFTKRDCMGYTNESCVALVNNTLNYNSEATCS